MAILNESIGWEDTKGSEVRREKKREVKEEEEEEKRSYICGKEGDLSD